MIQLPEAFSVIVDLAMHDDIESINELEGCWHRRIDDRWYIAVNGHDEPIKVEPHEMMGATVPPFEAAIFYNGWLAGLVGPSGGAIAHGEAANEDSFIQAVREAMQR